MFKGHKKDSMAYYTEHKHYHKHVHKHDEKCKHDKKCKCKKNCKCDKKHDKKHDPILQYLKSLQTPTAITGYFVHGQFYPATHLLAFDEKSGIVTIRGAAGNINKLSYKDLSGIQFTGV